MASEAGGLDRALLKRMIPDARQRAIARGGSLLKELAAAMDCCPGDIGNVSAEALGMRCWTREDMLAAAPVFRQVSFTDCQQRMLYPVGPDSFVLADPWDDLAVQWLANRIGCYPAIGWGCREDIASALERAGQHIHASSGLSGLSHSSAAETADLGATHSISIGTIERSQSVVVRFVDAAIYDAWKSGASDIHFECSRDGVQVKLRLDGVLVAAAQMTGATPAEEAISRIKVLAQLDIAERRVPQDGRFRASIAGRELDFRVSVMPSIFGEDAVVRLLDKGQLRKDDAGISLSGLGLDGDAVQRIRALSRRPHGMLLVTGPTGSGKTTTLYAALSEIQTGQDKIITIEDPVEYELPGVLQIPVNEKKGLTFSQGLRSILRHDPDKILVGEIRDAETAEIAVQAALTGHLVFTTVHANSVFDVISRFAHMHIDLYSLMSALNGVVAQRLIRCNCPRCSEPVAVTPDVALRLKAGGIDPANAVLKRGNGCEECRQTGYKGRHAVAEVLPFDDVLRTMVLNRLDVPDIKRHAQDAGVRPLARRALDLVAAGATTLEEIDRVIAHE